MNIGGIDFGKVFLIETDFKNFNWIEFLIKKIFFSKITKITQTYTVSQKDADENFKKQRFIYEVGSGVVLVLSDQNVSVLACGLMNDDIFKGRDPFILSLAFVSENRKEILKEAQSFVDLINKHKSLFVSQFGVMIALDKCQKDEEEMLEYISDITEIISRIGVPVLVGVSISFPPNRIAEIMSSKNVSALVVSGYVDWKDMQEEAKEVFFHHNSDKFINYKYQKVYGKYLNPLTLEWVRQANKNLLDKPLVVGGGILRRSDVNLFTEVGARAIILDRALFLRIFNIFSIIRRAKKKIS